MQKQSLLYVSMSVYDCATITVLISYLTPLGPPPSSTKEIQYIPLFTGQFKPPTAFVFKLILPFKCTPGCKSINFINFYNQLLNENKYLFSVFHNIYTKTRWLDRKDKIGFDHGIGWCGMGWDSTRQNGKNVTIQIEWVWNFAGLFIIWSNSELLLKTTNNKSSIHTNKKTEKCSRIPLI